MSAPFLLQLDHDGITLHRDGADAPLAHVKLDAPAFDAALAEMRRWVAEETGLSGEEPAPVGLVLPDSQILYSTITASGLDEIADRDRVRFSLEDATPYRLDELCWDWRLDGRKLHIAVIAQETIDEADTFASQHGFVSTSYTGAAGSGHFPGAPVFRQGGPEVGSAQISPVETAVAAKTVVGSEKGDVAEKGDGPEKSDGPEKGGEQTQAVLEDASRAPTPTALAPVLDAPVLDAPMSDAPMSDAPMSEANSAEAARPPAQLRQTGTTTAVDHPNISAFDPQDRPQNDVSASATEPDAAPFVSVRASRNDGVAGPSELSGMAGLADQAAPSAVSPFDPGLERGLKRLKGALRGLRMKKTAPLERAPVPLTRPNAPQRDEGVARSEGQRVNPIEPRLTGTVASASSVETARAERAKREPRATRGKGLTRASETRVDPGAATASATAPSSQRRGTVIKRQVTGRVVPAPIGAVPSATQALDEADSLTVFGARRANRTEAGAQGSLGVALTAALVAIMGLVGLWSLWFGEARESATGTEPAAEAVAAANVPPVPLPTEDGTAPREDTALLPQAPQTSPPERLPAGAIETPTDPEPPTLTEGTLRPEATRTARTEAETAPPSLPIAAPQEAPQTAPAATITPLEDATFPPRDDTASSAEAAQTRANRADVASPSPAPIGSQQLGQQLGTPRSLAPSAVSEGPGVASVADTPTRPAAPAQLPRTPATGASATEGILLTAPRAVRAPRIVEVPGLIPAALTRPENDATAPIRLPRGQLSGADRRDVLPEDPEAPLPPGSVLGADGLVIPRPEGAWAPGGYALYTGRPPIVPPVRPGAETETTEAALLPEALDGEAPQPREAEPGSTDISQAPQAPFELRPRARPADESDPAVLPVPVPVPAPAPAPVPAPLPETGAAQEQNEGLPAVEDADSPGAEAAADIDAGAEAGAEAAEAPPLADPALAAFRPRGRPDSFGEVAEALRAETARAEAVAQQEAQAASASLAAAAAEAAAEAERLAAAVASATRLAVASAPEPRARPANIAQIAERAQQAAAPTPQPVAAQATPTPTPTPPTANTQTASAAAAVAAPAPNAPIIRRADRVRPNQPSSALVARQATQNNALRLNRVTLIGVYGSASQRRALVRLPTGRYVKVQVGDRVDGGRVSAISRDALQYTKSGRAITLEMPSS
ncbi:MAG: hypothetical protein AAGJ91_02930 [Pseudomonadota bacterium]